MGFDPANAPQQGPTSAMPVRLIKGLHADYVPADWAGENTSGLKPYGPHVLVRMDVCSPQTMGLIHITDDMIEKMNMAAESGCIYAIGSTAFKDYYSDDRPQVGDRVYIEKYAGVVAQGRDGESYRIMDYTNVYAGLLAADDEAQPTGVGR